MRTPFYPMPSKPDPTDRAIAQQFASLNGLVERRGWNAARVESINQLAGLTLWLEQAYGRRATYDFFQQVADGLVTPELHDGAG
jgi:hypothetical protein